jgi:hypothetical protein
MKLLLLCVTAVFGLSLFAQTAPPSVAAKPAEDYSGTYSFLQDGEFVQVNLEDEGKVTGFISRYGDSETDRGLFLDHFFKDGKLDGNKLSFSTKTVHSVWYEFKGTVEQDEGKKPGDEGYYVLKGTLIQYAVDAQQKTTSKSHDVALKSFPQDLENSPDKK